MTDQQMGPVVLRGCNCPGHLQLRDWYTAAVLDRLGIRGGIGRRLLEEVRRRYRWQRSRRFRWFA